MLVRLTWRVNAEGVLETGADDHFQNEDTHEDEQELEGAAIIKKMSHVKYRQIT